jgi:K+-transporting ATPase KdpF subunit
VIDCEERNMTEPIIGLIVGICLGIYLLYTLLYPEKF